MVRSSGRALSGPGASAPPSCSVGPSDAQSGARATGGPPSTRERGRYMLPAAHKMELSR